MGFKAQIGNSAWRDTMSEFQKQAQSGLWTLGDDNQFLSELAVYHGVCAGLAVLTEGILVAPLEGVVSARFITNGDGSPSLAISFAGPFVAQVEQDRHFPFLSLIFFAVILV